VRARFHRDDTNDNINDTAGGDRTVDAAEANIAAAGGNDHYNSNSLSAR